MLLQNKILEKLVTCKLDMPLIQFTTIWSISRSKDFIQFFARPCQMLLFQAKYIWNWQSPFLLDSFQVRKTIFVEHQSPIVLFKSKQDLLKTGVRDSGRELLSKKFYKSFNKTGLNKNKTCLQPGLKTDGAYNAATTKSRTKLETKIRG